MNSSLLQCEGIVLRNLRFGETSRILTLFTREAGKLGVMAKGARDPKNPFGASLELFIRGGYILYYRSGRDLQLLRTGWVEQEYGAFLKEPRRYAIGSAALEFLDRVVLEDEPLPELYELTVRALSALERTNDDSLGEVLRAFQLRVATLLGYAPRLESCLHCGRVASAADDPDSRPWLFRIAEGGILCPDCATGQDGMLLRPRAVRRLHTLASGKPADGSPRATAVRERPIDRVWQRALDRVVEDYLRYHLERYHGLRSLQALGALDEAAVPLVIRP